MKTIYTPIAVSSGELPEREDELHSVDVVGLKDDYPTIVYYRYETKTWSVKIDFWLKKEEVPELTEEEIKHKADIIEDIIWDEIELNHDKNNDRCTADNQSVKNAALRITATTYPNKVEVKWEENMK